MREKALNEWKNEEEVCSANSHYLVVTMYVLSKFWGCVQVEILGRYQTLPLGSKSSILEWEVSILQLYIFIWNMKSKVLDSQQWWSSIIVINLCSCNGLLASEGPDSRVYGSEFELLNKWWWWSWHIMLMSVKYDGCQSW